MYREHDSVEPAILSGQFLSDLIFVNGPAAELTFFLISQASNFTATVSTVFLFQRYYNSMIYLIVITANFLFQSGLAMQVRFQSSRKAASHCVRAWYVFFSYIIINNLQISYLRPTSIQRWQQFDDILVSFWVYMLRALHDGPHKHISRCGNILVPICYRNFDVHFDIQGSAIGIFPTQ